MFVLTLLFISFMRFYSLVLCKVFYKCSFHVGFSCKLISLSFFIYCKSYKSNNICVTSVIATVNRQSLLKTRYTSKWDSTPQKWKHTYSPVRWQPVWMSCSDCYSCMYFNECLRFVTVFSQDALNLLILREGVVMILKWQ